MTRPMPPTGANPPTEMRTATGEVIDLVPLAQEICRRYREEFPDEQVRYGDAGNAWCVHDNQHLLDWAAGSLSGWVKLEQEVGWLADVLEARDFPLNRLARNLDIGAQVVRATWWETTAPNGRMPWRQVRSSSGAASGARLRSRSTERGFTPIWRSPPPHRGRTAHASRGHVGGSGWTQDVGRRSSRPSLPPSRSLRSGTRGKRLLAFGATLGLE